MTSKYMGLSKCRICGSFQLNKWLDLGSQPLANNLLKNNNESFDKYPLEVYKCEDCTLSQLSIVVDPNKMFNEYLWRSSTSQSWREHCKWIVGQLNPGYRRLVVDIGANDGCLLNYFKEKDFITLGIEPSQQGTLGAENFYNYNSAHSLWNIEVAQQILIDYDHADIITATNVLAHVDNVHEFLEGVKLALAPDGIFYIEVPYLKDLLSHFRFDTIYHEHLSYFTVKALYKLMSYHNLKITKIDWYPIHGGSLGVTVRHKQHPCLVDKSVETYLAMENNINLDYNSFQNEILLQKIYFLAALRNLKGKTAIYGASAKATVFLNYMEITSGQIWCAFDDNQDKWFKTIPGTGIQVFEFCPDDVDNLILTSWNVKGDLILRARTAGFQGDFWCVINGKLQKI